MTISVTFSKPAKNVRGLLDRDYIKIRVWRRENSFPVIYDAEFFTEKQSFRKTFSEEEFSRFKAEHAGKSFKVVVERTESEEITTMSNRHGEIRCIRRPLDRPLDRQLNLSPSCPLDSAVGIAQGRPMERPIDCLTGSTSCSPRVRSFKSSVKSSVPNFAATADRKKNYIIREGVCVPFLLKLGVMKSDGKIVSQKYDKFRQINRFLEYIDDILDDLKNRVSEQVSEQSEAFCKERPLRIVDFGCGKSYLTFAVYYFLSCIRNINVDITGLDLKADVIADCQKLAEESGYENLRFRIGNIADYDEQESPDMVISLHACDKATDYALDWAVKKGVAAILSVPCCQHEINTQLQEAGKELPSRQDASPFASLARYGIIRERLAALATDAVRAELLEEAGYSVQMLEFIDMAHTPKNILIRAVKKRKSDAESSDGRKASERSVQRKDALLSALGVSQELDRLLANEKGGPDLPSPPSASCSARFN